MPNTARQFNGTSAVAVIHDPLLGELQVVVSKPGRARPSSAPFVLDEAPAETVAAPAHQPTGPPSAKMAARAKDRRS
jgi:hypothetical protein